MSPATDFIDPNLSGTASKAFHLFSTEPKKQFCIVFFFLLFGVEGLDCLQTKFFVHFFKILLKSWPLYLSFLPPLIIFIHKLVFWMCYSILFFVCLIRRKVKLNKHTQSTFMYNHVYLWNIEGVLCVHVNVAQNQSSYG